jgi:transposase
MLKMNHNYKENFFDEYVWNNFIDTDNKLVKIKEFIDLDFIEDLVEDSYKNDHFAGRDPIDPRILFLTCLLEFIEELSDVKAEEKLFAVPLYRWFVGLTPQDKVPDASTISFFRVNRMGEEKFKTAFDQIIKQLHAAGLISGEIQSQDATDMRADIALINVFQLINKGRLGLLKAVQKVSPNKYRKLLEKSDIKIQKSPADKQKHFEELIDAAGLVYDAVKRSPKLLKDAEVQKEMDILGRILEERKDECFDKEGKKQKKDNEDKIIGKMINPSDPDASWGAKSDKKFFSGYKVESNVDHKYDMITEIEVSKAGHPEEKSAPILLQRQKENLGIVPDNFTADAKYDAGNTRVEIKAVAPAGKEINLFIPLIPTKNKEGGFTLDDFFFENDNLVCPAGYPAEYMHSDEKKMSFEFKFNASVCNSCTRKSECTISKYGRRVLVSHTQMERRLALSLNASEIYNIMYKEQHWKVEPRNADLKRYCGMGRARYRGLARVKIQACLSALAANLKKLAKFIAGKIKDGVLSTLAKLAALPPPKGIICLESG